jgi:RimJ/RimL family protein N-acetyltransferase
MKHPNASVRSADIFTERLDLIAITREIVLCEQDGLNHARSGLGWRVRFESLLSAKVPEEWPPQDWEPHVLEFILKQVTDFPGTIGWTRLVALRDVGSCRRTLIGTVGAMPPGTDLSQSGPGEIEVGYGILPAFQRRGFATEALAGMMAWVSAQVDVKSFVAQTFPELTASIRVLEKSGFASAGPGYEGGTLLFRLPI